MVKKEEEIIVFDHELAPKHKVASEEEVKKILATYRIKPYQLPQIKFSDPAIKALNVKPGDVIKIIRKSETAGETVYYRYVVEGSP